MPAHLPYTGTINTHPFCDGYISVTYLLMNPLPVQNQSTGSIFILRNYGSRNLKYQSVYNIAHKYINDIIYNVHGLRSGFNSCYNLSKVIL